MGEDKEIKKDEAGTVFKPPEQKKGLAGFSEFLYNSSTGEFLGRTGTSWAKITVFYIIFYACLAAVWALFLTIFLQTLEETAPKWQGANGIIGANPGLGFRPSPPYDYVDSTLIMFTHGQGAGDDWKHWTTELEKFWEPYAKGLDNSGEFVEDCSFTKKKSSKEKVCFFDTKTISEPCFPESFFGYDKGNPCIFIKLNKIYGWEPQPYDNTSALPESMPAQLKNAIKENARGNGGTPQPIVWLSCEGENPADKENIGPITYSPLQGFPAYHFPYLRTPGYLSPFVAVQLKQPSPGVLVNIECKAWAKNIRHNRMDRIGIVHFEFLMD